MKHIELEVPIEDMDEADLRATLTEVLAAHEENAEEYDELTAQVAEAEQYSEQVEQLESELADAKAYFAEKGEVVTGIDSEMLVERFEMSELSQFAEKYDEEAFEAVEPEADEETEFSEEPEGDDEEEEADASIFAERPSKAPAFSSSDLDARKEAAKERLSGLGGLSLE